MGNLLLSLSVPAELNPQGVKVRMAGTQRTPLFCLADVCEVIGISNHRMVADRLDEDEKGVSLADTPGGQQEMLFITEAGLYSVLLRSDKPSAKPFRRWVCHEVLPSIREFGMYPPPPDDQRSLELVKQLVRDAQALYEQELRLAQVQREVTTIKGRVTSIEDQQRAALDELLTVERSTDPAAAKSIRAKINELTRAYAVSEHLHFNDCWNKLYRELRYRNGFDAKTRAKNAERAALDVVETAGLLPELFAIASEIFVMRQRRGPAEIVAAVGDVA